MTADTTRAEPRRANEEFERILVCVSASPTSAELVRATARLADKLNALWVAVHVETPGEAVLTESDRQRLAETLHLAEQLGGAAVTLIGHDVADELIAYARTRKTSKVIVGRSPRVRWRDWMRPNIVGRLARNSAGLDLYVISASSELGPAQRAPTSKQQFSLTGYLGAVTCVVLCTGLGFLMFPHFAAANIIMVYLLGVVTSSLWFGRGPSILASIFSVAAFDFFFIPPYLTFDVDDKQYVVVFAVMLITGLVISTLTGYVRFQVAAARSREQRTSALYALSGDLLRTTSFTSVVEIAAWHISKLFDADIYVVLPEDIPLDMQPIQPNAPESSGDRRLPRTGPMADWGLAISEAEIPRVRLQFAGTSGKPIDAREREVAEWVFEHGECAGFGTETMPSSRILFVPMPVSDRRVGALGILPRTRTPMTQDQVRMCEAFAGQIGFAIVRIQSSSELQKSRKQMEHERLHGRFLQDASNRLQLPLDSIRRDSEILAEGTGTLPHDTQNNLVQSIRNESERLARLVGDLVYATQLHIGAVKARCDWVSLKPLVSDVVGNLSRTMKGRIFHTQVADDLPPLFIDPNLMSHALSNLLEVAHGRAPLDSPIGLSASIGDGRLEIEIVDRGPNLAPGEESRIFDALHVSSDGAHQESTGLKLLVCRGIVELHDGWILAENRIGGGAAFHISIPQPTAE